MRNKKVNARDQYIRDLYAAETELLTQIRATLAEQNLSIHVSPEEGKLLQVLVRLHRSKHIVEIGTLGGYSALWMAEALPADGHITTFEKSSERAEMARKHIATSPYTKKITVVEGDAHAMLREHKGKVDMVFIDAEKTGYPDYLEWAEQHLPVGGLLVADNTFLFDTVFSEAPEGEAKMWNAMRQFNAALAERFEAIILPTAEGLSIALKPAK
jgi:predicted O-methyltransferase YrrM